MEKKLGKISKVSFGFDDYSFGLHMELSGKDSDGCGWETNYKYTYNCAYKGADTNEYLIQMINKVQHMLNEAQVERVEQLLNKPIEVTCDGNIVKEIRILTEVL